MLLEVASVLPTTGPRHVDIVIGGSLLAWRGLRDTTADVESVKRLENPLRVAVAGVAKRHDLAAGWLNDFAAGFVPATLSEEECPVLIERPHLLVLGAPLQQVFVMKLLAARAADFDDLTALWGQCGFASPKQAAELWQAAYTHLERDDFLTDFIRSIAHG
ncbi:MAG: hypothetical protein ACLPR9_19250 [Acidimicrobiales bacterium]